MKRILLTMEVCCLLLMAQRDGVAAGLLLNLGPEEFVQAGEPLVDIMVFGYSVPSYVDWDNNGKKDLIVGEGGGGYTQGKIRIYRNNGTVNSPQFSDYFYVQSNGSDLTCPASGCLGCFPRIVYWDIDGRKDLLVGQTDGTVKIFLNTGTDSLPVFDGGTTLQVDLPGFEMDLDVGYRATPTVLDWDNDGRKDLVVGALDGKIHLYINCGCSMSAPVFYYSPPLGQLVQENDNDLIVPHQFSSPVVLDLDSDGKKDLLVGNTEGQLLFYSNEGTDLAPTFSGYWLVESNGVDIDLPDRPRSRPFVCDWTGDGYLDVLVGAGDGKIHLFQGMPTGDLDGGGNVNFADFALFGAYWWETDCGKCGGADLTGDGNVGVDDLQKFLTTWLAGVK